jgi:hypothetical protein
MSTTYERRYRMRELSFIVGFDMCLLQPTRLAAAEKEKRRSAFLETSFPASLDRSAPLPPSGKKNCFAWHLHSHLAEVTN